jgi:hypothetical protein
MSQKEYVVKYKRNAAGTNSGVLAIDTDTQVFTDINEFKKFISSLQRGQDIELYERVELDYDDFMKDTLYHLTYQINHLTTGLSQTLTKSFKTFEELSKFANFIVNKHTILSVDLPKFAKWIKEFKRIS